jgi:proteasome beta subunit
MIRQNLPAAMQGLVVVPIFAGYDVRRKTGRLWKYDVTGGRYEETEFETTGSGGLYAKDTLKKRWRPDLDRHDALRIAVEALMDAADEDRATGGVDVARGIFPVVKVCTAAGIEDVSESTIADVHRDLVASRGTRGSA